MEQFQEWISQYGYLAVMGIMALGIVGLPAPEETLLAALGVLVADGRMEFLPAMASSAVGACLGITTSYLIGRLMGKAIIRRLCAHNLRTRNRVNRIHRWFERAGRWFLSFNYFLPGIRHFTAVVAGATGTGYHTLALFAYPGAVVWCGVYLTAGYYFGIGWLKLPPAFQWASVIVLAVLICGGLIYFAYRWFRDDPPA